MGTPRGDGSPTLQDLVDTPELGMRTLYSDSVGMAQPVGWTFTTDLLDPSRYLSKGLLVMTGLMWRRNPEDSDSFVNTLAEAGAIALIAGEGLMGYVPDDLVDACRTHNLPLLAVTASVSFVDITEHITAQITEDRVTQLTATLVRQRKLLTEVAEGQALDEVVLQVSRESGLLSCIVTSTGRSVVSDSGVLGDLDIDAVTEAAVSSLRLPISIEVGGTTYSIFAVGGGNERITGWFLIVKGHHEEWSAAVLDAMHELTAIAALDKARQESSWKAWHEITDATFNLITRQSDTVEPEAHLKQIGVDVSRPIIVVAAKVESTDDRSADARWLLTDAVSHVGRPVVGVGSDDDVIAVVAIDKNHRADRLISTLTAAVERAAPALGTDRLTLGMSQPSSVAALGGALRSARYARHLACDLAKPVEVVLSADVNSALLLLNSVPDSLRRTFAEHVLGPVIAYDARGAAELLATLRAYFECAGSWSRTAERLDLHLNTVRYRIARVEKLTQRDLGRMEDRMDVYLALHLL